jgi:hypothetical protein
MSEHGEDSIPPQSEAEFFREIRDTTMPFDPELLRLVHFFNVLDTAELGITLHVNGGIISGMLISMTQYFRLLTKAFGNPSNVGKYTDPGAGEPFVEFFRPSLESAEKSVTESRESHTPPPSPRHIHLRQAHTLVPGQQPYIESLWRGRLTQVDGWSISLLAPIPPLDRD